MVGSGLGGVDDPMTGSYVLLVDLAEAARIPFGAAGLRDLPAGRYAYVGSARGAGGFARLRRHREVARGEREVRHWHVDHLLGHEAASVAGDRRFPPAVGECDLAGAVQGEAVDGVGSTDCRCGSHLLRVSRDLQAWAPTRLAEAGDPRTGGR